MTDSVSQGVLVSVIIATFNRAATLRRAVLSVLQQTHANVDVIVVDDGSKDDTAEVLGAIGDSRVCVCRFEQNRGVAAARNAGFGLIRGAWFTLLDSDDELLPEAVETLLKVPRDIDPSITHVECNCIDAATGKFTGEGLDHDQYLTEEIILTRMRHDHWGMYATTLLGEDRFNEALPGFEDILWFRLRERARSYYIHRGLKVVHREGGNRLSRRARTPREQAQIYRSLLGEQAWFEKQRRYTPGAYAQHCFWGMVFLLMDNDRTGADVYFGRLNRGPASWKSTQLGRLLHAGGPPAARAFVLVRDILRQRQRRTKAGERAS